MRQSTSALLRPASLSGYAMLAIAVVLEHVADLGLGQALAVEQDLAGVERDQPGDHVDQRALAAAVGAEHGNDLVLRDVEIEVFVQRPAGEVLRQAADGDVGAGRAGATCALGHVGHHGGVGDDGHDDLPLQWTILRSSSRNTMLST
jgi:hypothetical protein